MLPVTTPRFGLQDVPFRWGDRDFDRLLNRWWGEPEGMTSAYPVDIHEDQNNIYVEAEMPGFRQEEVDLTVEDGILHITGEHKEQPKQEDKQGYHLNERRYSRFHRAFTLPTAVDDSKAEAKLDGGVLYLTLPKAAEVKPRRIEVK